MRLWTYLLTPEAASCGWDDGFFSSGGNNGLADRPGRPSGWVTQSAQGLFVDPYIRYARCREVQVFPSHPSFTDFPAFLDSSVLLIQLFTRLHAINYCTIHAPAAAPCLLGLIFMFTERRANASFFSQFVPKAPSTDDPWKLWLFFFPSYRIYSFIAPRVLLYHISLVTGLLRNVSSLHF